MNKKIGDMTVRELLKELRKVSEARIARHGRRWNIYEQICHNHSEVSELYRALRHAGKDVLTFHITLEVLAGEIWDIVFSAITNGHILKLSDDDLLLEAGHTLRKIKRRAGL